MKKFPLLLVVLLAMSASIVLVACGSSSDDSSDSPALTKSEWISQADAICAKGDAAIQKAAFSQFGTKKPSQSEIADFVSSTEVPNFEQQASDLRDLTPPSADEDTINSLLNSLDDGISTIKDDPAGSVNSQTNPLADATTKAKAYGLKKCGSSAG